MFFCHHKPDHLKSPYVLKIVFYEPLSTPVRHITQNSCMLATVFMLNFVRFDLSERFDDVHFFCPQLVEGTVLLVAIELQYRSVHFIYAFLVLQSTPRLSSHWRRFSSLQLGNNLLNPTECMSCL